ncbi:MAG: lytic transglycosylase domain-containing protein [Deltaproteobacteria bacterium]|nr:lytic transglycosylase domain-containing protein [Deltaproteobacteria bacterium]
MRKLKINALAHKMLLVLLIATVFIPAMSIESRADIFVKQLIDGRLIFTDCPSGNDWTLYMQEKPKPSQMPGDAHSLEKTIRQAAKTNGIEPRLIRGIIEVESNFVPTALSSKGAIGLMQLLPDTAAEMGVADPWDPAENIRAGTRYIAQLLKRYDGDLVKALAAYNAGPTMVDIYNGIPPYQETREYVKNVLTILNSGGE